MDVFNTIDKINTFKASPVQSEASARLIKTLTSIVNREAASLRTFAALKPGRVADHCNRVADEIEAALKGE